MNDASIPGRALLTDTTWLRLDATTLLAGSPVRLFRVTGAGGRILDAIERGVPLPAGHRALTDRLLAAGAVHPAPNGGATGLADVTVVVPAYGETRDALAALLEPLAGIPAIVVDDGSPVAIDADRLGDLVQVIRLVDNRGPGAARNAGLAQVTTPFVLFLDADAATTTDVVRLMLGHFADPPVAAVAPRVHARSRTEPRALERYEEVRSPLDMGRHPALVRAGTRVSYVPAAVLLCRTDAVRAIGGFDESLRYGEDVDLVWRLTDAGHRVRYEPAATARHAARRSLRALLRQRYLYGTAAGALAHRHPGALAPVRLTTWGLGTWIALALGRPLIAAAAAISGGARLSRKLVTADGHSRWAAAARVTVTGNLHAGRQLADATISVWLPAALATAVVSKRARGLLLAAAVVPGALEWLARRPRLDLGRFLAIRALERAAYGAGVVRGAIDAHEWGPLRPAIG